MLVGNVKVEYDLSGDVFIVCVATSCGWCLCDGAGEVNGRRPGFLQRAWSPSWMVPHIRNRFDKCLELR